MSSVTDEEFYDHYGEWYSLADETDTLVALLSLAVARFRRDGFAEPVNAIEVGWNLENYCLVVSFVSNPDYACYGQMPAGDGVRRRGAAVAHTSYFRVPSWAFLFAQASPNLPAGPLLRVLDPDRVEVAGRAIPAAAGRNVFRVVLGCREAVFAGVGVADPHWLIVYFHDEGGGEQLAQVSRGEVVIHPPPSRGLSQEWFAERSGAAGRAPDAGPGAAADTGRMGQAAAPE